MGSSHSRQALLQCESAILQRMSPVYTVYDVDIPLPRLKQNSAPSDESISNSDDVFPIRTLCVRAEDNGWEEGSDKGSPIVLVHGYMFGLACFFKLIPFLLKQFQKPHDIYAFDLLGHGASGRPKFTHGVNEVAETEDYIVDSIHEWITAQFPPETKIHLCGHSFGGTCTALYALAHPERIASVGLMSPLVGFPPVTPDPNPSLFFRALIWGWESFVTPQSFIHHVPFASYLFRSMSKRRFQSMASGVTEEEGVLLTDYIDRMMKLPPSTASSLLVLFAPMLQARNPVLPRLLQSSVHDRLHVYQGDVDWMRRDEIARMLPSDVPFTRLSAGHHLHLDAPEALAIHMLRRIDRLESASRQDS